ncbi:MAG: hypothetical protein QXS76_00075 [Candidatus Bathyarchaeia archaeon]
MVGKAITRIYGGKKRTNYLLYLRSDLVQDSAFPFQVGEPLQIRIDGSRLVIERAPKGVEVGRRGKADRA